MSRNEDVAIRLKSYAKKCICFRCWSR